MVGGEWWVDWFVPTALDRSGATRAAVTGGPVAVLSLRHVAGGSV